MKSHPQTGFTTVAQAEQLLWNAAQKVSNGNHRLEKLMIRDDTMTTPNLKNIVKEARSIKNAAAEVINKAYESGDAE